MKTRSTCKLSLALIIALALTAVAQRMGGSRRFNLDAPDRGNVPVWELPADSKAACFTFARLKYRSTMDRSSYAWWTDYPDADLNMSWRLHHLTTMQVDPNGKVVEILSPELRNYPWLIMSGPPAVVMSSEEALALRKHLLNGGFLMVDDFWGEANWNHFYHEVIKQVFPDREPRELPLSHPLFSCVFAIKEKPQIPNVGFALRNRNTGITWEVEDGKTPHYRAVMDDKGRIMMLICHNTDLGDGWEEEATDPYFFTEFSEKKAYPLGINIIVYSMTH